MRRDLADPRQCSDREAVPFLPNAAESVHRVEGDQVACRLPGAMAVGQELGASREDHRPPLTNPAPGTVSDRSRRTNRSAMLSCTPRRMLPVVIPRDTMLITSVS